MSSLRQTIRSTVFAAMGAAALTAALPDQAQADPSVGILREFSELTIQDQNLISHGSRIMGANEVLQIHNKGGEVAGFIGDIAVRLDATLETASPGIGGLAAVFYEQGKDDAVSGRWNQAELGAYATNLYGLQELMSDNALQEILKPQIAAVGIAQEHIDIYADEIVRLNVMGHGQPVETMTAINFTGLTGGPIELPQEYIQWAAQARDYGQMLTAQSGFDIEKISELASQSVAIGYELPVGLGGTPTTPAPVEAAAPAAAPVIVTDAASPVPAVEAPAAAAVAAEQPPAPAAAPAIQIGLDDVPEMSARDMLMIAHGARVLGMNDAAGFSADNTDARRNVAHLEERITQITAGDEQLTKIAAEFRAAGTAAVSEFSRLELTRYSSAVYRMDQGMDDDRLQNLVKPALAEAGVNAAHIDAFADEIVVAHLMDPESSLPERGEKLMIDNNGTELGIEVSRQFRRAMEDAMEQNQRLEDFGTRVDAVAPVEIEDALEARLQADDDIPSL